MAGWCRVTGLSAACGGLQAGHIAGVVTTDVTMSEIAEAELTHLINGQLVLPVKTTIFAGRGEVNHPAQRCRIDHRPTNRIVEAAVHGRKDSGNGGGHGRYECVVSTEMTAGTLAVGDETGAQMAHPARSL